MALRKGTCHWHELMCGHVKWLNQSSRKHLNSSHFHQPLKHLNKMFEGRTSRQPSGNQLMSQIHLNLNPTEYGWARDEASKSLVPIMVPSEVKMAPPEVLELIQCGCSSSNPCSTARCSCSASKLPCTLFCTCHREAVCGNQNNTAESDDPDGGDNDDDTLENI